MKRTGRTLVLGCLLLLQPLLAHAQAGGNSLLIPAMGRCTLNTQPESQAEALSACQKQAEEGDAQAQYELGEYYHDSKNPAVDLNKALSYFEKASLQGHAQAQYQLGNMFFKGEGVPANNVQAYIVLKWPRSTAPKTHWTLPTKSPSTCSAMNWKWQPRCWGRFSATTCRNCRVLMGVRRSHPFPDFL